MIQDGDTYDLLDKYLSGNATLAERTLIEERLTLDEGFREEFELYKVGRELVFQNRLQKTSDAINALRAREFADNPGINRKILSIGIVLMVTLIGVLVFNFTNKDKEESIQQITVTKEVEPEETFNFPSNSTPLRTKIPVPEAEFEIKSKNKEQVGAIKKTENEIVHPAPSPENKNAPVIEPEISSTKKSDTTSAEHSEHKLPPPTTADKCTGVKISANIHTIGTCPGKEEGALEFMTVRGGKPPYTYQLGENSSSKSSFKNLPSGKYMPKITDQNGCSQSFDLANVVEKNCIQQHNLAFNPSLGETTEFPISKNQKGTLRVMEKSGALYYKRTFNSEQQIIWDGNPTDGNIKAGFYIYIIDYADGTTENGTVTIIM